MVWIKVAAWLGALSVALGAFAAHGLKERLVARDSFDNWKTAVLYQMFHVVGILVVGLLSRGGEASGALRWAPWAFLAGIVLFCGSLYVMALVDARWLGPVTPIGGLLFLAGWLALALGRSV